MNYWYDTTAGTRVLSRRGFWFEIKRFPESPCYACMTDVSGGDTTLDRRELFCPRLVTALALLRPRSRPGKEGA
eukprot:6204623-Pleurochrysis_carterae.AAC.1